MNKIKKIILTTISFSFSGILLQAMDKPFTYPGTNTIVPVILLEARPIDEELYNASRDDDSGLIVEQLLKEGANPNFSKNQITCLSEAVRNYKLKNVRLLLNAGADPNVTVVLQTNYNGVSIFGSILHIICDSHPNEVNDKIFFELLKHGANPLLEDSSQKASVCKKTTHYVKTRLLKQFGFGCYYCSNGRNIICRHCKWEEQNGFSFSSD